MTLPWRGTSFLILGAAAIAAQTAAITAQTAAPAVPENLKAPVTQIVLLKALGKGQQIYTCQARPAAPSKFEWTLKKPQADLFDEHGKKIGKHYEGPTWESADGSKVTGEVQERAPGPAAGAIPWLLLKAKTHESAGAFAGVTYIQRVETAGGAAPTNGCDASQAGKESAVDYQAQYYFYAPRR